MPQNTIESLLQDDFGDLHQVIPQLVSLHGQQEAAQMLGVPQRWISHWLKRHGYVLVKQWVREAQPQ